MNYITKVFIYIIFIKSNLNQYSIKEKINYVKISFSYFYSFCVRNGFFIQLGKINP